MIRATRLVAIVVAAFALSGCATNQSASRASEPAGSGGRTSDGALLTLGEDETGPVWRDWQPREESPVVPEGLGESARAFDYWRVEDASVIGEVWSAVFPVLDAVRAKTTADGRRDTLNAMLEALEPDRRGSETRMDLTFLVSADEEWPFEGFACRVFRPLEAGTTPVLTVLFLRPSEGSPSPTRIAVWAAPGFRETPDVTAYFERRGDTWRTAVDDGLQFPDEAVEAREDGEAGRLAAGLLVDQVWKRFAGKSYAESRRAGGESGDDQEASVGVDEALGLEVNRREIDQVYSDTEFPPRAEFEDLR
jgi:hypothetical protein